MGDDELEQQVIDDLVHLANSWTGPITQDSVRRDSAILRRLLIDKALMKARHSRGLKGEPTVRAIDLTAAMPKPWDNIEIACTGGAFVNGGMMLLPVLPTGPLPPPPEVTFLTIERKLSGFMGAPCMIVAGQAVQRTTVLRYVANKLGGVHYDPRRNSNKALERLMQLLDEHRGRFKGLDLDPVHLELLSMGQDLLRAPDIAEMLPAGTPLPPPLPETDQPHSWTLDPSLSMSGELPAG